MLKSRVVKRVKASRFVSPLTVAINKKKKKRLCIDLSRGLNNYAVAKKFKIKSLKEVMATVEEDDYVHIDDGVVFVPGKEQALQLSRKTGFKRLRVIDFRR